MSFQFVVAFIKETINNGDNYANDVYDGNNNGNNSEKRTCSLIINKQGEEEDKLYKAALV
jgi:hypothetical protein